MTPVNVSNLRPGDIVSFGHNEIQLIISIRRVAFNTAYNTLEDAIEITMLTSCGVHRSVWDPSWTIDEINVTRF